MWEVLKDPSLMAGVTHLELLFSVDTSSLEHRLQVRTPAAEGLQVPAEVHLHVPQRDAACPDSNHLSRR